MGQRSQIYIRFNVNHKNKHSTHNFKGLIARDFGWNYGERMVSRARYIIEHIHFGYMKYKWNFNDAEKLEKLKRICEVNFDMKDIVFSSDIIKDVAEYMDGDLEYLFNQANNDGQLFIDVTDDGIKYCFMKFYNEGDPMDAEQYMKWNCENESHSDWHQGHCIMESMCRSEITQGFQRVKVLCRRGLVIRRRLDINRNRDSVHGGGHEKIFCSHTFVHSILKGG